MNLSENNEDNNNEDYKETAHLVKNTQSNKTTGNKKSFSSLTAIPNKKRFRLLSSIITITELAGFFISAYAFIGFFADGFAEEGLVVLPIISGIIISYFTENRKESLLIALINGSGSIIPFVIIFAVIEKIFNFPRENFSINAFYILLPLFMLLAQMGIAYTITRMRQLYYEYGDKEAHKKRDEDLIKTLKKKHEEKGIEITLEKEKNEENIEENNN